ncbi:MAG: DUF4238 domain-containing protein [Chloroflexi bacterium]|nr:DUF4238 domain-containing protein [Chloroflexota bacterium]
MVTTHKRNHYVPEWYQRRFLPIGVNSAEFYRLDLKPDSVVDAKGKTHKLGNLKKGGPQKLFVEEDLYTTTIAGLESNEIERTFFGRVDRLGQQAVDYFATFDSLGEGMFKAYQDLIPFLCMQKFRTPKGLKYLSQLVEADDKNIILSELQRLTRIYGAVWTESIWCIADATSSDTKFIVSDHPVTVYNEDCKPESEFCRGANDPEVRLVGSHTLFPLSLDKLLVLTNLSWVRNPYQSPLNIRPNPELNRPTVMSFMDIQVGRKLTDTEVNEVNYIIKRRAYRYVAAADREWLFPESKIPRRNWRKLGGGYLLFPDPRSVSFSNGIMMGYQDGSVVTFDEYGRSPMQEGYGDKNGRDGEWKTFQAFQGEFARIFGPKRKGISLHPDFGTAFSEDSEEMHQLNLEAEKKFRPKFARRRW